ncbi:Bgt-20384 [Blumeria graminis f. sp. tritici]|uniref:Bgt-20384 n=2 Tax=Blumeria graminis f. sp. tritici TaxID=62690 RepID=A0A9X9QFG7_BLUGR|nr:Bgt-20384 [Blumeria graminis f. sp. tritici]
MDRNSQNHVLPNDGHSHLFINQNVDFVRMYPLFDSILNQEIFLNAMKGHDAVVSPLFSAMKLFPL